MSLFFITTNISYSDYNMDTIKDEYHSKSSLNDSFDLVYSNIKIKNDELIFRQSFILLKDSYVELIGDLKSFLKNVTNNKKNVKVIKRNNLPCLYLRKGEHNIKGKITLSPNINKIHVHEYVDVIELSTDDNKRGLVKLSSPYLRIKADNLLESIDDEDLLNEIVDIANSIDLDLKKVMFHFTLNKF